MNGIKNTEKIFVIVIVGILLFPSASALQLEDNFFFTIPAGEAPPELRCTNVVFPDVIGFPSSGLETYTLSTNTDWASLSYRIITTDGNNTVIIPVCYAQTGESLCSDPYVISILAQSSDISKEYRGGVCLSEFSDVDIVSDEVVAAALQANENPMDVLNNNVDLFDIGFEIDRKFARPGEIINYLLFLESQALLDIDLSVEDTGIGVRPQEYFTTTSSINSFREIQYSVTGPLVEGEYSFEVEARVRNCDLSFCSKKVKAYLVVTEAPAGDLGFSVKLFPLSLNIRELRPVLYRFTIDNKGPERSFDVRIDLSEGLTTTFRPLTLNLPANGKETISFTVVPTEGSRQYQIVVTATTGDNSKPVTAYLSTNEMLTDTLRDASIISADGGTVNSAVNNWMENYNDSEYGQDLDEYEGLRASLDQARAAGIPSGTTGGLDITIIIIIIAIVVAVIIVFLFLRKRETYLKEDIEELK